MHTRQITSTLAAAAGGLLTALSVTTATATADGWVTTPTYDGTTLLAATTGEVAAASPAAAIPTPIAGDPGFTFVPDPGDGPIQVETVSGLAPFYTSLQEFGTFVINDQTVVVGNASLYSDLLGDTNTLFERMYNGGPAQIIDQFNFGSSGFANAYSDVIGGGPNGTNAITDTLITPFGDVNIPTMYDAAALFEAGGVSSAAATDWLGADF